MESRKVFQNRAYTAEIFQRLSELREQKLCDITLVVDKVEIHAHKVVLIAGSEFFKSLLTKNFKESRLETISLRDVNANAVNQVVNYMYASPVQITIDNVFDLLHVSRVWFVNSLLEECCQFLMNCINISNALLVWTNARQVDHIELKEKAELFLGHHFTEIMNSDQFLELEGKALVELLSIDSLKVTSENQIHEYAISWINHDQEKRKEYVLDIIGCIRISLIDRPYLVNNVLKNELIKNNTEILNKVYTKLAEAAKKRICQHDNSYLLVMGGNLREDENTVEYYNFNTETWHKLPNSFGTLAQATISSINDKIYVIGKTNLVQGSPVIAKYDFSKQLFDECRSLANLKTSFEQVVIANNFIYSFCNGSPGLLSIAEKIDLNTGMSTNIAAMRTARSKAAICVLDNFIYVIGGYNFMTGMLKSVERYNLYEDVWERLADMKIPRQGAGVAAIKGLLYVVGGADESSVCNTITVYNPDNDLWTEVISTMSVCRFRPTVVSYKNLLYVTGGIQNTVYEPPPSDQYYRNSRTPVSVLTKKMEVYNPENQIWTLKSDMSAVRMCHGAIVINTYNDHVPKRIKQ